MWSMLLSPLTRREMYIAVSECVLQAETEVATLTRKVRNLEEDFEQAESRLVQTSTKLDMASQASDESER